MDFDLKFCFTDPPRFKDEVKKYFYRLSTVTIKHIICHMRLLHIERLLNRHVRLIFFQLSQDPVVKYSKAGLVTQTLKIKPLFKVFKSVIDRTEKALENNKYGNIDKKIVKCTQALFDEYNTKSSHGAVVCVAACIAEVCGIMLNATQSLVPDRTLSLQMVHSFSTTHMTSSGQKCMNASLHRFLCHVEQDVAIPRLTPPSSSKPRQQQTARLPDKKKSFKKLEEKTVSFAIMQPARERPPRPSTPVDCFWEDD